MGVRVGVTARGDIAINCIACGVGAAGAMPKLLLGGGAYPPAKAAVASSSCTPPLLLVVVLVLPKCAWNRLVSMELLC